MPIRIRAQLECGPAPLPISSQSPLFLAFADLIFLAVARFPEASRDLDGYATLVTSNFLHTRTTERTTTLSFCGDKPEPLASFVPTSSTHCFGSELARSSLVLAHSFPTLVAPVQIARLAPLMPPKEYDCRLVYRHHQFLYTGARSQPTYPFSFANAARYLWSGRRTQGTAGRSLVLRPSALRLERPRTHQRLLDLFLHRPRCLSSALRGIYRAAARSTRKRGHSAFSIYTPSTPTRQRSTQRLRPMAELRPP